MTPRTTPWLAALTLAAAAATLSTAHAALVLYEQAPLHLANALANGSDGQAPLLAETFSFSGVASSLSWWGTAGEGFDVSLTSGSGTGPVFSIASVRSVVRRSGVLSASSRYRRLPSVRRRV